MHEKITAWCSLFRVKNLITVPGDVVVGYFAAFGFKNIDFIMLVALSIASILLYMFGLVDNDIVGIQSDSVDRPLVSGIISLKSARIARAICLAAAIVIAKVFAFAYFWWPYALVLVLTIIVYNRTKRPLLMGFCRGLNVLTGGSAYVVAALWTIYIAGVTKFSERETIDSNNGSKVAVLINLLIVFQIAAIIIMGCCA